MRQHTPKQETPVAAESGATDEATPTGLTDEPMSRHSAEIVAPELRVSRTAPLITLALILIIVAATIAAYSPILFNFFVGDDFGHLTWLKEAVVHHELIWKNFYSSWLDGTTTKFYRPLISVFMVTDYLMWGFNGLGFHITNLLFHLTSTILIFFIARNLLAATSALPPVTLAAGGAKTRSTGESTEGTYQSAQTASRSNSASSNFGGAASSSFTNLWLYPLSASLIFGLYPLHTEAVSWITGRVDVIVAAFYLASFWCYLKWRTRSTEIAKPTGAEHDGASKSDAPRVDAAQANASQIGASKNGEKTQRGSKRWLAGAIIFMCLGLMSKEMAVTLPVLFVAYEFLFHPGKNLVSSAINTLKATVPFWLVIVAYFALRRYALGTLVGGYDDSLFFVPDVKQFVALWIHGLRMFIEPLNKSLMGAHHILTRTWEIHLALLAVTFSAVVCFNRNLTRLLLFNLAFLAIAFVPVYKIFNIADDLQGNRLAHLATVALSLLIAICFAPLHRATERLASRAKLLPIWQAVLATTFSVLCFAVLWTNNQAWANAGREANAIRVGLDKLYAEVKGDPQVLLVGLPDNIDGAYVMRNALQGMTRTPQMHRDVYHNVMLNQFEQTIPIGFFKESIREAGDAAKIFWWNSQTKEFVAVEIPPRQAQDATFRASQTNRGSQSIGAIQRSAESQRIGATRTEASQPSDGKLETWYGADLKQVITDTNGHWLPDGSFEATTKPGRFGRPEVILDLGTRSSFDTNFVSIKLRDLGGDRSLFEKQGADLLYSHRITGSFSLPKRTHGELDSKLDQQEITLPLRSLPEWAFRGTAGKLLLLLPRNSHLAIESISILAPECLFPSATLKDSGVLQRKGEIHLSQKAKDAALKAQETAKQAAHAQSLLDTIDESSTMYVDATKVPNASATLVEVTRCNLYFEFQNMPVPSKVIMTEFKLPVQGAVTFKRDMFPSAGIYEARAWALDRDGKRLGVAGDHIVVSVDD